MQMNLSQIITSLKYGSDYIKGAKDSLKQWDFNKDGKTSAIEMYKDTSDLYSNVFDGNDELLQKADGLALKQGEIYDKYAGEDGILDEYEYSEALNSDEYGKTLDEYWEMNAQNKFGQEYLDSMQSYTSGQDIDGDGKTTAEDMYQSRMDLHNDLFSHDPELMAEGQELAEKYKQAWQLYANSDGNIEGYNAALALNSDTFKELDAEYAKLHDKAMYYFEDQQMQEIDADYCPDGQVTKGEVKVSNSDFYGKLNIKEGADEKIQDILAQEDALVDKFVGDDGVFSAEEYHQYQNSDEHEQLIAQLYDIVQ